MRLQSVLICLIVFLLGSLAFAAAPTITSFTPSHGPIGTVVTVTGTFLATAPTAAVNGTSAPVNVTTLTLTVAPGTTTGKITVTTPEGTASSATDFRVTSPPTISPISAQVMGADTVKTVNYSVQDVDSPADSLLVTATSSNTSLLKTAKILSTQTGTDRVLTITPEAGKTGVTTITVTVKDGDGLTASTSFVLTVNRYKPDLYLRPSTVTTYTGIGIYSLDGSTQTVAQSASVRVKVSYYVQVQNLGSVPEALTLHGTVAPTGWTVVYTNTANGALITDQVCASGWTTPLLAVNGTAKIKVDVTPNVTVSYGAVATQTMTVTSSGDPTKHDVGLIKTSALVVCRPDLYLRPLSVPTYTGIGIYSLDGATQTVEQTVLAGVKVSYYVQVQNLGSASEALTIYGSAAPTGWTVVYKYTANGAIITEQLSGAGWSTPVLAVNGSAKVQVDVTPGVAIAGGAVATQTMIVTSSGDPTKQDVGVIHTTVIQPAPTLTSFTPTSGAVGQVVTLSGTNFTGTTAVTIGGTPVTSFNVVSASTISAIVGSNATGTITVTTPGGMATSSDTFTFIPAPTITSFTPSRGVTGTTVFITGTNFTGTTAVTIGGTSAASFNVVSDSTITATVGSGATGKIAVTTPGGTAVSVDDFIVADIGEVSVNPVDGVTMVWVPGGSFTMGTEFDPWWNPPYTQQVTLSGYWIYKYEVTVAQYLAFCAATSRALPPWAGNTYSWAGKTGWDDPALQQHPMVNVTWYDAKAYADWAGVQLPTEAQWEYAARGPQGRNFPWGGTATAADPNIGWDQTKCANYENSWLVNISTWPVGSFPSGVSWCGAQDLAGNVWEWCADWYGDYSSTPVTNPTGPETGSYRVMRGGSWSYDGDYYYRGALRGGYYPDVWSYYYGFRCASVSPGPAPTIASFTPSRGDTGTVVTITGTNFTGATAVTIGGTPVTSFNVVSASTITATVGSGATGKIAVTTPGGAAVSVDDFIVADIGEVSVNPVDGATMVWVPGGSFTMGTEFDPWWNPPYTQQVTLSGYWIYKYEVTVAQYRAFCAATSRALPPWPGNAYSWRDKSGWNDPALQQHPIVDVTWYDAKAYADWAGVQLPTEAQWEYAARGPQGRNYPWGGTATAADPNIGWDQTKCANYENSWLVNISTWPVGSFPGGVSWCGAQDLAGNAREWCADWNGNYSSTPVTNPTGPETGTTRVLRGGSWDMFTGQESIIRSACRYEDSPGGWVVSGGFRCASVSPGP